MFFHSHRGYEDYWIILSQIIIKPSYRRKSKYRLYTFTDLFLLWFANTLNMYKISVHKSRKVLDTLRNMLPYTTRPLVDLSFLFDGARILIFHGQVVMQEEYKNTWISLEAWELRKRVDELYPIPKRMRENYNEVEYNGYYKRQIQQCKVDQ